MDQFGRQFEHKNDPYAGLPPRPKPFTLWKFNLALIVLFVGLLAFLFIDGRVDPSGGARPYTGYSYAAGQLLSAMLFPLLIGWVAYMLGRRSNRAGNIVFLLLFILSASSSTIQLIHRFGAPSKSLTEFQTSARALNQQLLKDYEEGSTTGTMEHLDKMTNLADNITRAGGTEGLIGATMKDVIAVMKENIEPLETIINDMAENPLDLALIKSPEDFDPHIARAKAVREETKKYLEFYDSLPTVMRDLARKNGVSKTEADAFAQGGRDGWHVEEHRQYRQTITDFCSAMEEYCVFLKENWGKWEYNEDIEEAVFKPNAPSEIRTRFAELSEKLGISVLTMLETEEEFMKKQLSQ